MNEDYLIEKRRFLDKQDEREFGVKDMQAEDDRDRLFDGGEAWRGDDDAA